MSVSSAMYAAITGLNAMGTAMSVISNNIANVNTVGFKAARANFQDLLSQNYHGGAGTQQVGRGVSLGAVTQIFGQGAFQNSSQSTDIAIAGDGFFMVKNPNTDIDYYTRAGNFVFDKNGYMITQTGERLQGWQLTNETPPQHSGAESDIQFLQTDTSAHATSTTTFVANLDARSTSRYAPALANAWNGLNTNTPIAGQNYVYQTSMRVYDSEGGSHDLSIYFDPSATLENVWDYIVTCNPSEDARTSDMTATGSAITNTSYAGLLQSGTITFDPNGKIRNITASNLTAFTPGSVTSASVAYAGGWNVTSAAAHVGGTYTGATTGAYNITLNTSATATTYNVHWVSPLGTSGNTVFSGLGPHNIPDGQGVTFRFDPPGFPVATAASFSFNVVGQTGTWTPATPDANGVYELVAAFQPDAGPPGHVPPAIPARNTPVIQNIAVNFGAKNTSGILGNWISDNQATTQYASPSTTLVQTQDGYTSGYLEAVSVGADGVVTGTYSNGRNIPTFQIGLAIFRNPWGLQKIGMNLYQETQNSGNKTFNNPGTGGTGTIAANSLEQSNVDLAQEFVDMIIQERGFQANSKTITTTDSMMAELINLKR